MPYKTSSLKWERAREFCIDYCPKTLPFFNLKRDSSQEILISERLYANYEPPLLIIKITKMDSLFSLMNPMQAS